MNEEIVFVGTEVFLVSTTEVTPGRVQVSVGYPDEPAILSGECCGNSMWLWDGFGTRFSAATATPLLADAAQAVRDILGINDAPAWNHQAKAA